MWFADIVVDLAWFSAAKGKLGDSRARSSETLPGSGVECTLLLYGDDYEVRHLRVLIQSDDEPLVHRLLNENISRWVNLLEVTTGLAAGKTASTASLGPDTSAIMVFLGSGDEHADSLTLTPQTAAPEPINYAAAALMMAAWKDDFKVHLFYLSRFLNKSLPPEVRWLNGYRVLEWHFRRGAVGLAKDLAYRDFLEEHGKALDALLQPDGTRKGIMEEVRALCAHSILSKAADPRTEGGNTNLILRSFSALEVLVMEVMKQGVGGSYYFYAEARASGLRIALIYLIGWALIISIYLIITESRHGRVGNPKIF